MASPNVLQANRDQKEQVPTSSNRENMPKAIPERSALVAPPVPQSNAQLGTGQKLENIKIDPNNPDHLIAYNAIRTLQAAAYDIKIINDGRVSSFEIYGSKERKGGATVSIFNLRTQEGLNEALKSVGPQLQQEVERLLSPALVIHDTTSNLTITATPNNPAHSQLFRVLNELQNRGYRVKLTDPEKGSFEIWNPMEKVASVDVGKANINDLDAVGKALQSEARKVIQPLKIESTTGEVLAEVDAFNPEQTKAYRTLSRLYNNGGKLEVSKGRDGTLSIVLKDKREIVNDGANNMLRLEPRINASASHLELKINEMLQGLSNKPTNFPPLKILEIPLENR